MNRTSLVFLIVAGVTLALTFLVGSVFLILFVVTSSNARRGGWPRLTEAYGVGFSRTCLGVSHQTIQIGTTIYDRCVNLKVANAGLYVTIYRESTFIPWSEMRHVGDTSLRLQKVPLLAVGHPAVATITLPAALFQKVRKRVSAATPG